jgi:hypothetical protein
VAFNFKKAQQEAAAEIKSVNLGLMVLGQSGAGKSTLAGTFGVKTLYLYTTGESHGAKAAATLGGDNVSAISINVENGAILSADKAYDRLLSILDSVAEIKAEGFGALVIDGATELEILIRETSRWKLLCQTDKGTHNSWAEGKATLAMFRPIVDKLKNLQRQLNIHFMMTCALDVVKVSDNGEIEESKPRLQTYSVAEGIIQQFEDIVVIGRMSNGEKVGHRLQFLAGVSRESKDTKGNVRKSMNFNPRLSGVVLDKLPETVKADIQELIKLKKGV